MSVAVGTPAAIGQPLNSAFLITIKDLVTSFTGDAKLLAKFRHAFASEPPSHKLQSLIHHRTLLPRHSLPPQKGKKCNPCVRYNLLPMCRVAHQWFRKPTQDFTPVISHLWRPATLGWS